MSFWSERIPGARADVVFVRNNTGETLYYRNFELYACSGLEQACGVDPRKVLMPPHAIKQAIVVRIVDTGGYSYKVRMIYGHQQPKSDTQPGH